MRYAIISDIHGNWEALEAVLEECRKLKVEMILCAGDIVGYGASPKECLKAVQSLKMVTVAGNHDWAVCGRLDPTYFTNDGKAAVMWTRSNISVEDIHFLSTLPISLKNKECAIVHASLNTPERFMYLTDIGRSSATFALMEQPVCFVGHTHVPLVFVEHASRLYQSPVLDVEIEKNGKYIVNAGSVGQPRDGNPLASFCFYDSGARTVSIKRVAYDIQTAQRKIIEAGLPGALAARLSIGQ